MPIDGRGRRLERKAAMSDAEMSDAEMTREIAFTVNGQPAALAVEERFPWLTCCAIAWV